MQKATECKAKKTIKSKRQKSKKTNYPIRAVLNRLWRKLAVGPEPNLAREETVMKENCLAIFLRVLAERTDCALWAVGHVKQGKKDDLQQAKKEITAIHRNYSLCDPQSLQHRSCPPIAESQLSTTSINIRKESRQETFVHQAQCILESLKTGPLPFYCNTRQIRRPLGERTHFRQR